ncbi:DUF2330 domain-containing protein [Ornithinimicrobium ciconiae]|nr:DUF2330 domain-containing protein [Ornithinimicrobium ciconiae]
MGTRTSTWWARAAAAGVAAAAITLSAPSAMACACGGMVSPDGGNGTSVDREVVVLHHDGDRQTIHLQLGARGNATEAGLLLPTPNPAEVELGEEEMFDDLAEISQPRVEERRHLIGDDLDSAAGGAEPPGSVEGSRVQVLSVTDLGPLEATVLTADDPGALTDWLDEHGYVMKDALAEVIEPYIDERWAFVAVKLTLEGKTLNGDLPPLTVSFDSDEFVYPMRMSSAAAWPQDTRTYVVAEHKVERTDDTAANGTSARLIFAGEPDPTHVDSPALQALLERAPYVTAIDQYFGNPEASIVSDFRFASAADNEPFQRVTYVDTYLMSPQQATLGGGGLVVLLGGLVVLIVLRRRSATN